MQIKSLRILTVLKWIFLLLVYPFIFLLVVSFMIFVVGGMNGYFVAYQYLISNKETTRVECYSNTSPRELHKVYCRENQNHITRRFVDFYENK
jgi:hypothetical protein